MAMQNCDFVFNVHKSGCSKIKLAASFQDRFRYISLLLQFWLS